jgi:hypothetical protein
MTRVRFAAWLWLALAGCATNPPPDPNPPGPAPHVSCVKACDHIQLDLGCPVANDCAAVCTRVADSWFTSCLAGAETCEGADECDAVHSAK